MTDPDSLFIVQIIYAQAFSKEDTKMHCRGERFFALTSSETFVSFVIFVVRRNFILAG